MGKEEVESRARWLQQNGCTAGENRVQGGRQVAAKWWVQNGSQAGAGGGKVGAQNLHALFTHWVAPTLHPPCTCLAPTLERGCTMGANIAPILQAHLNHIAHRTYFTPSLEAELGLSISMIHLCNQGARNVPPAQEGAGHQIPTPLVGQPLSTCLGWLRKRVQSGCKKICQMQVLKQECSSRRIRKNAPPMVLRRQDYPKGNQWKRG